MVQSFECTGCRQGGNRRSSDGTRQLTNVKGIGGGVLECRIDFGPGYRVYFGRDGDRIIILLGGGTKKRQKMDIEVAKALWKEYKKRKRQEI